MFYDNYALLCAMRGVSCKRAAVDSGISHSAPAKWKATGATPNGETLAKLAAYFGVSVDQLLGVEPINNSDVFSDMLERPELLRLFRAARLASKEQIENIICLIESINRS